MAQLCKSIEPISNQKDISETCQLVVKTVHRRGVLLALASMGGLAGCGGQQVSLSNEVANTVGSQSDLLAPFRDESDHAGNLTSKAVAVTTNSQYVWRQLATQANSPINDQDGSALLSYKGLLFLIGGWNPDPGIFVKRTTNAVWRSVDGISWTNIKPDTFNSASFNPAQDWQGRHTFGCVVFNDRMWIFGGDDQQSYAANDPSIAPQNDIWSSTNGVSWRYDGDLPFNGVGNAGKRILICAIVFNGYIWIMGGQKSSRDPNSATKEIWRSADGLAWQRMADGPWSPRYILHQAIVYRGRLWVLGGAVYNTVELNDVWSTVDGISWTQVLTNNPNATNRWGGRSYGEAVVFDDRMWLLTGYKNGVTNVNDVWFSQNGVDWTMFAATSAVTLPARHASGVVEHGNTLRVVTGNMWRDSWMLSPYEWESVPQTATPHFGPRDGLCAVSNESATKPKVWLLGGYRYDLNGAISNDVWSTSDCKNWSLAKPDTFNSAGFNQNVDWAGREMMSAAFFVNRLWIVGGFNGSPNYLTDVWSSSNGSSWNRVTSGLPWLERFFHSVVVFKNKVWVFGGQNNVHDFPSKTSSPTLFFNDVWSSSNCVNWTRVTAAAPWAGRGLIYGSAVFKGRMWVIGGGRYRAPDAAAVTYNDVWSTEDGANWTLHTANAPWSPRRSHSVCVFDNRLWIIGGYSDGSSIDEIWSSADGANWAQLPAAPGANSSNMWPRRDTAITMHLGMPHLIGGPSVSDVWRIRRAG